MRNRALSARLAPDVRELLSLPGLPTQTGGAFVLNALIEADRVVLLSGNAEASAVPTPSGKPHEIYRCPSCRVALWSIYGGVQKLRFVRVGTLDTPQALPPMSISTSAQSFLGSCCRTTFRLSRRIMTRASFGHMKASSGAARFSAKLP
jgi:hypothetical protein